MTRILIAGGSGQVGQAIVKEAQNRRIECHILSRSKNLVDDGLTKYFYWDPEHNEIDTSCFEGVELLVNLSGKNIDTTWNEKNKTSLISSRLNSVKCLAEALKNSTHRVKTIINASAIGIYQSANELVNEDGALSTSFLGRMATKWEESTAAYPSSIKVVSIRLGLVLGPKAKLVEKIGPPAKMRVCAIFGSGKQWVSWIHEKDLARAVLHLGLLPNPKSVYNLVAPETLQAQSFYKQINGIFATPKLVFNVPEQIVKLLFKDKSELFLSSQRVSCALLEQDFKFMYPTLAEAAQAISKKIS